MADPTQPAAPRNLASADHRLPTLAAVGPRVANDVVGRGNYIGVQPGEGTAPTNTGAPAEDRFVVDTAGIRAAENELIWEGDNQATAFEEFKRQLTSNESWVFLVSNPKDMTPTRHKIKPGGEFVDTGVPSPPGSTLAGDVPNFTDPDPAKTQQMIDSEHQLIRAAGDSIWSIAHFAAMLNNAAQLYALADESVTPAQRSSDSQSPLT